MIFKNMIIIIMVVVCNALYGSELKKECFRVENRQLILLNGEETFTLAEIKYISDKARSGFEYKVSSEISQKFYFHNTIIHEKAEVIPDQDKNKIFCVVERVRFYENEKLWGCKSLKELSFLWMEDTSQIDEAVATFSVNKCL